MDEVRLRAILSGTRRTWDAGLLRGALRTASIPYGCVVAIRNRAYTAGWLQVHRAGVPVVSVGNLTAGGTGKTPICALLTEWYVRQGARPVILSRGYGAAAPNQPNDEKLVLDRLCPGVPQRQGRNRVTLSQRAIAQDGATVLLLDDGFQHRRLHRDVDLVLIDALQPWGYGHLLPRGLLREPLRSLQRAQVVIITRANLAREDDVQAIEQTVRRWSPELPVVRVAFEFTGVQTLVGEQQPLSSLASRRVAGFCGIGNPAAFFQQLGKVSDLAATWAWPDHHRYTRLELDVLVEWAQHARAELVVTTLKDAVKIAPTDWTGPPLVSIEQRAVPLGDWSPVWSLLTATLARSAPERGTE